ncbi:MAG: thiamine-binding protein [Nitriliruptoraceae bacterium]|nr:thiamine-binding protein [Nitriliruptoraceae bacterium]
MLGSFSVTPMGGSDSVGDVVAGCVRIVRESGLPNETGAMFTTVEGSPAEVFAVIERCIAYAERFAPRVSVVAKFDHRPGHEGALEAKVARVERALSEGSDPG